MADFFNADMKIDQEDFQSQIEQARSVTVGQELREFITGEREAADKMRAAKENALLKARKKLAQGLYDQYQAKLDQNLLPIGASQDVNAWLDEGTVKVSA